METPLLSLADGDILSFKEDHYCKSTGCETCNYGSSYVQDFTVVTTKGTARFDFSMMYEYAISHDFLMKTILRQVDTIRAMTLVNFIEWLAEQFRLACKDNYIQPKFSVENDIK
jgi:hypothetical protein